MSKIAPIFKVYNKRDHYNEGCYVEGNADLDYYRQRKTERPSWWEITELTGDLWAEREDARLALGLYERVPHYFPTKSAHRAHVAIGNPLMIAFTESHEKGVADRQTVMKPGRYLKKFYPTLSEEGITELATKWAADLAPVDLRFGTSEDDFERVYCGGIHSCMAHPADRFVETGAPFHPVRVYAAGDLAVAYFEVEGVVKARTLVWPEKKIYVAKTYGDGVRLTRVLKSMGYVEGSLVGARIQRVPMEGRDGFVLPYIDNTPCLREAGDHFVIDPSGSIAAITTVGHTSSRILCAYTGEWMDPNQFSWVSHTDDRSRVYLWSRARRMAEAFECSHQSGWYVKELGCELPDGSWVLQKHRRNYVTTCAGTGEEVATSETMHFNGEVFSTSFIRDAIRANRVTADPDDAMLVALAA